MVEHFIVIQLLFDVIVVPQDFTIRAAPGLSGPTNTCDISFVVFKHLQNLFGSQLQI